MNDDFKEYMSELKEWADNYLEHGFSIIPVSLEEKKPAIVWKEYQTKQPTQEEVDNWFTYGVPDGKGGNTKVFGLAIITGAVSNLVVVDCDNAEALQYALNEGGIFSNVTVKTTRGNHFYFRHPGYPVQNRVGGAGGQGWVDIHGLDLRGDGGYVVAPPSLKWSNKENRFVHQYKFEMTEPLEDALIWMPTYQGLTLPAKTSSESTDPMDFSFENLCLDGCKGDSIWDEIKEKTTKLHRKLNEGEGRNIWVTRYAGYCASLGMTEDQIKSAVEQFMTEFFSAPLPSSEYESTIRSVIARDKIIHPERYKKKEEAEAPDVGEKKKSGISLITPKSLPALQQLNGDKSFLIDPFISPQSITQVVGFNGHGKTLWLMSMLWSASIGKDFGAATIEQPLKILYLDYELSATTITDRIDQLTGAVGEMSENMAIWAASISDIGLDLNNGDGIKHLRELLEEVKPQIVVIDTVRSAWQGMEENSPSSWVKVNQLCMAIRNTGCAVVFVHHRNKPSSNGFGREAGSTAQLKDLDTQIIVTKVIKDREQAEREAALPDSTTKVILNDKGSTDTAWGYLKRKCPPGAELTAVFQIAFGKVRQITENHETSYVGLCTDIGTGKSIYISSLSPRQRAKAMAEAGKSFVDIALQLKIPRNVIQRWTQPQTIEEGEDNE